ncbi:uncharacterized protein LOC118416280 [Branchiostoma floridae]|uniref:Uncharacterized protein LOC118416280 n=1 Tax=Branchiostoma floridae TaxID=7739 RepID=A0A9J7L790_BRAFL|nr:uncharacterized protein LOC118416280 [Branchiostoma floridae]
MTRTLKLIQGLTALLLVAGASMLRAAAAPCGQEASVTCRDGSTPGGETCKVCARTTGDNAGDEQGVLGALASLSWIFTENGFTIYESIITFWSNGEPVPVDSMDLYLPEKTMPLGVFPLQLSVTMTTTSVPRVIVGALQTWVQFLPLPIIALHGVIRTDRPVHSMSTNHLGFYVYTWESYDQEGLVDASDFSSSWTCEPVRLPDPALFSTPSVCNSIYGPVTEEAPGHFYLRRNTDRMFNITFVFTFEVRATGREPAYASMYVHTPEVLWGRIFTVK